jgi:serine/threonine protein phosphatase PrpC
MNAANLLPLTGVSTHQGQVRDHNEDGWFAAEGQGLWAVADGMGGHENGEWASRTIIDALVDVPLGDSFSDCWGAASRAIHAANAEIWDEAERRALQMGSTVVALCARDGMFAVLWVGDSRAYLLRGGEIMRVSHDHSLVQNLVDAGMIKPEEAETHANANLITRAVGVAETVEVDIASGEARSGDMFLLASDGLTRVVADDELATELQRGSLDEVADRLLDTVLERGAPDNVSLIIVRAL